LSNGLFIRYLLGGMEKATKRGIVIGVISSIIATILYVRILDPFFFN
jgi:hypothetical protein